MKSVLIGSVSSSHIMLEEMLNVGFPVDYVFGLDEKKGIAVSGFSSICNLAERYGIANKRFERINTHENCELIRRIMPDYIFVIGLSQLVCKDIIECASKGVVGCHPAPLPKYRGRASVVWQMLCGERTSKCTLFLIDEGMDSGDILGQEDYFIGENDYACDVQESINKAFRILCRRVLVQLMDGTISPQAQNQEEATYTLLRTEADGEIDWHKSAKEVHLLIRAISDPYPGAFSFYDGVYKFRFDKAEIVTNSKYIGFDGQIAFVNDQYMDILTNDGILRVTEYASDSCEKIRVGHRFRGKCMCE